MEAKRRDKVAAVFATRTRDQWAELFAATDGCVAPVLSMDEAEAYPHARARNAFPIVEGVSQPAPGPRFSETPGEIRIAPEAASRSDPSALAEWGLSPDAIAALCSQGIVS
jgi:alpha-methylacyl-CoA racemase